MSAIVDDGNGGHVSPLDDNKIFAAFWEHECTFAQSQCHGSSQPLLNDYSQGRPSQSNGFFLGEFSSEEPHMFGSGHFTFDINYLPVSSDLSAYKENVDLTSSFCAQFSVEDAANFESHIDVPSTTCIFEKAESLLPQALHARDDFHGYTEAEVRRSKRHKKTTCDQHHASSTGSCHRNLLKVCPDPNAAKAVREQAPARDTASASGKAEPERARKAREKWKKRLGPVKASCQKELRNKDSRYLWLGLTKHPGTFSSALFNRVAFDVSFVACFNPVDTLAHKLELRLVLRSMRSMRWQGFLRSVVFWTGAQDETLLRYFHLCLTRGHICSPIFADNLELEESAFGFKGFMVVKERWQDFFLGLLSLFDITWDEFWRSGKNRQETVLAGMSRFGLKPADQGAGKWLKAYKGEVAFICDNSKKRKESKKGKACLSPRKAARHCSPERGIEAHA